MNGKKDKYVSTFQAGMLISNILAVGLICGLVYITTNRILKYYDARAFLDSVVTIPVNPKKMFFVCAGMMLILVITFLMRHIWKQGHNRLTVCTLILDALVCVSLVIQLDFNYNGLLLLVFANVIAYVKDGKVKILLVAMAIAGYLVADYELLSIYMPLFSVSDYIRYYPSNVQQYLFSIYNIMISLNIIVFIVYCVYVINVQRGTIKEVNCLYYELQTANEQLKEYADMSERMAQTRERNRLAREIHDTLKSGI